MDWEFGVFVNFLGSDIMVEIIYVIRNAYCVMGF